MKLSATKTKEEVSNKEFSRESVTDLETQEEVTHTGSAGVEQEDNQETHPFDPNSVKLETKTMIIQSILRRYDNNTINFDPDFQRNMGIWDNKRKSRLIESILLKIPLPMFYISVDDEDNWHIVDGLQRLSTICAFTKSNFPQGKKYWNGKLQNLEFWRKYEGKTFDGLSSILQSRILETELYLTLINRPTPDKVQRNVFQRINTGGMPLTAQEIRHALNTGKSTKLLKELVEFEEYKMATDYKIKDDRMAGRELILRFLAFAIFGYDNFKNTIGMDGFLTHAMKIINKGKEKYRKSCEEEKEEALEPIRFFKDNEIDQTELKEKFKLAMTRAYELFGNQAFRKSMLYLDYSHRSPVNKALFEVFSVVLSEINDKEFQTLKQRKKEFLEILNYNSVKENIFDFISQGSNKEPYTSKRYRVIKDTLRIIS